MRQQIVSPYYGIQSRNKASLRERDHKSREQQGYESSGSGQRDNQNETFLLAYKILVISTGRLIRDAIALCSLQALHENWVGSENILKRQPINTIREYIGERVSFLLTCLLSALCNIILLHTLLLFAGSLFVCIFRVLQLQSITGLGFRDSFLCFGLHI